MRVLGGAAAGGVLGALVGCENSGQTVSNTHLQLEIPDAPLGKIDQPKVRKDLGLVDAMNLALEQTIPPAPADRGLPDVFIHDFGGAAGAPPAPRDVALEGVHIGEPVGVSEDGVGCCSTNSNGLDAAAVALWLRFRA